MSWNYPDRLWVRQPIGLRKNESEINMGRSVVCLIFTGLPKQSERKESFCHEMRLSHPWERIPRKMAASAGKTTPLGFPHTAGACVWFCPVQHVKAGQWMPSGHHSCQNSREDVTMEFCLSGLRKRQRNVSLSQRPIENWSAAWLWPLSPSMAGHRWASEETDGCWWWCFFISRWEVASGASETLLTVYMFESVKLSLWTAAHWASLSFTVSWSLLKLMSIESVMIAKHLILCYPHFLLPSLFPSIRVFSIESVLCIRWPKYWSLSISPSNEYSGLISFRIDWFDLFAVQRTLKSLLEHHSSKASVLRGSAFFMVQLSHSYMTTGKLWLHLYRCLANYISAF